MHMDSQLWYTKNDDEFIYVFVSTASTCHAYQFKCLTSVPGQPNCAPENAMCDRVFECPDNSDEGFCKKGKYCWHPLTNPN